MYYAFLRVSTNRQNNEKFLQELRHFASTHNIKYRKIYKEVKSSRVFWRDRLIGDCLKNLRSGDVLLTPELSRLGRSMLDIMEIASEALRKNVVIHCLKNNFIIKNDLTSKILLSSFGIAAEIERELLVSRINEALAVCKSKGIQLGRRPGSNGSFRLKYGDKVKDLWENGVNCVEISNRLQLPYNKVYYLISLFKSG
jgi:DNA invertase Pin-like site-specific DNA recombinase